MAYVRIRKHYIHLPYLVLGVIEFSLLFAVMFVFRRVLGSPYEPVMDATVAFVFAAAMFLSSLAMGTYQSLARESALNMILRSLVSYCLIGVLAYLVLSFVFPVLDIDSGILFWAILLALVIAVAIRTLFVKIVDTDGLKRKIALIGEGTASVELYEQVRKESATNGFIVEHLISDSPASEPVLESIRLPIPDNIQQLAADEKLSELVLTSANRRSSDGKTIPMQQLLDAKLAGVQVTDINSFYERELQQVKVDTVLPSWLMLSDGFAYSKSRRISKRLFDLLISLALLIVILPFMAFTALAVFLETGRPVLYSQIRTGYNGKPFRIYKFRSMRIDAEKDGKAQWAKKNDSRITRVGSFIRNTRLDELPQLWNIINGTMSFVGPRPERPQFVSELEEQLSYYALRHKVKPGLMGWAQLKYPYGATVEDAKRKLEYDLYYVKNHSFFMDVIIIIQTVEVILLGKGVH